MSSGAVGQGAPGAPVARPLPILGVSLKLYLDVAATGAWAGELAELAARHPAVAGERVRLFALPSLTALAQTRQQLAGTPVAWGAQDLHWEDRGAFTGAVSGADLAELGCRYVEVGHAERKRIFGETPAVVGQKLNAAFRNGLTPVFCVGEQRAGTPELAAAECIAQLEDAFGHVTQLSATSEIVVAYEPEWAIGRPVPAPAAHVRFVADRLRAWLGAHFAGAEASVIYGGSAQRGTLAELGDSVDGLFLGRFAHRVSDLAAIVDEAAALAE
ncbi:triose-phosphate isomerase family protein [Leucobacter albus]|uniref:Triosephosphate isomerase n=1 Tax=Leucobacter albus TaxID=272210 RepID=A0ABW3TSZ0_9MICO